MTEYLFDPPAIRGEPIRGRDAQFPIRRIFCVGRNCEAHAKEMGVVADREARFHCTTSAWAYVPSGATVPYPPETENCHDEMELVAAIG